MIYYKARCSTDGWESNDLFPNSGAAAHAAQEHKRGNPHAHNTSILQVYMPSNPPVYSSMLLHEVMKREKMADRIYYKAVCDTDAWESPLFKDRRDALQSGLEHKKSSGREHAISIQEIDLPQKMDIQDFASSVDQLPGDEETE